MSNCSQCHTPLSADAWEETFRGRIAPQFAGSTFQVPASRFCVECRTQCRMAWRGELHLFKRSSDAGKASIISFYPPGSPCKVYSNEEWWSENWDPATYGKAIDFSRPFFEQFRELVSEVPLIARTAISNEGDCNYVNCAGWNKNCYLLGGANYNVDCYYGNYVNRCTDCVDNSFIVSSELCYDCVDCTNCYHLLYSTNCVSCSDSYFLNSCRNCRNCFGSVNLVNKEYHFFNEQLSSAEYKSRLDALQLQRRSSIEKLRKQVEQHRLQFPHRFRIGEMNENVSGNSIFQSKNCVNCFDVTALEDCRNCIWYHKSKDCMDVFAPGMGSELCYNSLETIENCYQVLFSATCTRSRFILYSYLLFDCESCFGCVGMKRASNSILNKAYTRHEYEQLAAKLVAHMIETNEWGEFFPLSVSPLPYNTSVAMDYYPLTPQEAVKLGAFWYDLDSNTEKPRALVSPPDNLADASETITSELFTCTESGKPFKIIAHELEFLRKNAIALPSETFYVRNQHRLQRRLPRKLWSRICTDCKMPIETSYSPERPERVVCEVCYQRSVD